MIWYLTYPWTRSVNPPVLKSNNPIRIALARYGTRVAEHPISFILFALVIGLVAWYPLPFAYIPETSSRALSLPSHVWSSTQPLPQPGPSSVIEPDVEIRQAWMYGSYMKALLPSHLEECLVVQNELLNLDATTTSIPTFHSPLFYWNNSASQIRADTDLVATVNALCLHKTPFNITLRPASVFAGKRFCGGKLVAADSVVITLYSTPNSPHGTAWDKSREALAQSKAWTVYHARDGNSAKLYEFGLHPVDSSFDWILFVGYCAIFLRVAYSLWRIGQGVKSKIVLLAAILVQNVFSVTSSFAVVTLLDLNMSRIPMEAFVFLMAFVGFENMLRFIDAVRETHPEKQTPQRIGDALGSFGLLTFSPIERLLILWALSKVVAPVVSPICTFVGIALVFDFLYFHTFFIAVVSADMHRLELDDFLAKLVVTKRTLNPTRTKCRYEMNEKRQHKKQQHCVISTVSKWKTSLRNLQNQKTWTNFRLALTPVLVISIVLLNWQSGSHNIMMPSTRSRLQNFKPVNSNDFWSFLTPVVHPLRTPVAWLYLQDREFAEEIIGITKPGAESLVALIHDPLVFLSRSADRVPAAVNKDTNSPLVPLHVDNAILDSLFAHSQSFLALAFLSCTLVGISLHLLLHDVLSFDTDSATRNRPTITARALDRRHDLDVVLLAASTNGVVASVGLDQHIGIWDLKKSSLCRRVATDSGRTANEDNNDNANNVKKDDFNNDYKNIQFQMAQNIKWPVTSIAIDDLAKWLVIVSKHTTLSIWSFVDAEFKISAMPIEHALDHATSIIFVPDDRHHNDSLLFVRSCGLMSEVCITSKTLVHHRICSFVIASCVGTFCNPSEQSGFRLLVLAKNESLHVVSKTNAVWHSAPVDISLWPLKSTIPQGIVVVPGFGTMQLLLSPVCLTACLVDTQSFFVIHTFYLQPYQSRSVRVLHGFRRHCLSCGRLAVASMSIVYSYKEANTVIMHTFTQERDSIDGSRLICLRASDVGDRNAEHSITDTNGCTGFSTAREEVYELHDVLAWEASSPQGIAGIRNILSIPVGSTETGPRLRGRLRQGSVSRNRVKSSSSGSSSSSINGAGSNTIKTMDEDWEAFTMSAKGQVSSCAVPTDDCGSDLIISKVGPTKIIGRRSIAIAMGSSIKVISSGTGKFDNTVDVDEDDLHVVSVRRKH